MKARLLKRTQSNLIPELNRANFVPNPSVDVCLQLLFESHCRWGSCLVDCVNVHATPTVPIDALGCTTVEAAQLMLSAGGILGHVSAQI
jgi:hypothetical protein